MAEVYIIAAVRTPIGIGKPGKGDLHPVSPVDLAAHVMHAVLQRGQVQPGWVEDVIFGCVTPIGDQGANIARLAALQASLPVHVPAVTLNRMCGSSQQAVHFAAQAILSGDMDLVLAGGIEMMSHQPLGADWPDAWPPDFPYDLVHQGISAEMMAEKFYLERSALDEFAYRSHVRAAAALDAGSLHEQIAPVTIPGEDGAAREIRHDQGVRTDPDLERMGMLPPVFKPDGVVTAGNSSQISDGAAALLLASERAIKTHNLLPQARVVARAVVGTDPVLMLDGPIPATHQVLERAGFKLADIEIVEINEAFASVVLGWLHELEADPARVNPEGGAIAHGHPLGATGGILMTKLLHQLRHKGARYGLQTMCIGHGMATATIIERV